MLKRQPIRSKKLREAARGEQCTLRLPGCDGGGETAVLAHAPFGGKGMGTKCNDTWSLVSCHNCHSILDGRLQSDISREEILEACLRGIAETQDRWLQERLMEVK